ncbi:MAG: right-handed parallel beta-helix repeat-containing protein [Anaeroplasmataceae bacterium]|nr:right-handed parallel beta-helix repeat-containing protein [Anaeroplasmataceae bacterium]
MKFTKKLITTLSCVGLGIAAFSALGINASAEESIIYVSPTGSNSNTGTEDSPKPLVSSLVSAQPGQTIILKEGVYEIASRINASNSGTNKNRITVKAESESATVVLDFSQMPFNSANRGIQLTGSYWYFYNIEITGAGDNGMYIAGSNNIVENCRFYKNSDTGLQLGRGGADQSNISQWPSNNLIKNCTSYYNYDVETLGENADGFAAKLTVGYGNVFDGCIAYRNSDDGWDLFAKADSGNIGTVMLYNCFSFENGFLPESYETNQGNMTFNTTNGDGIGFKLGGGVMSGDVIVENCVAFNNKLHGFSDNSNPGFIKMKNCTAVNNCIGLNEDGTVKARGIDTETQNKSNNFDMARDTNSYNSYYGLLSFIDNQADFKDEGDNSYNEDAFRGSTAYSIFQTSYDKVNKKEIYLQCGPYQDASVYKGDSLPALTEEYTGLTSDIFVSMDSINAIGDKMKQIHTLFRNEDHSIQLGNLLKLKDENLKTFAEGNPIGADLTKTSWNDYNHFSFSDIVEIDDANELAVKNAYDAVFPVTNVDAVYQNMKLPVFVNKCDVNWKSSNEEIIRIDKNEYISLSSSVYCWGYVSSPKEDTKVTLTATISRGGKSLEKTFELIVKSKESKLGNLVSSDDKDTYIVERYQNFRAPIITVTDASSHDGSPLNPSLYDLDVTYEWAESKDGNYIKVDNLYTSVPGVFKVTSTATLKSDTAQTSSYTYYIFIGKDDCEIDFVGGINNFNINATGFNIAGNLSNITGRIYAVVVDKGVSLFKPEDVVNHPNVQVATISSDSISVTFTADNGKQDGYKVYYVIGDKVGRHYSSLYTKTINAESITTQQQFYDLTQGITPSNNLTIYNLQNDLDFKDFEWKEAADPKAFTGAFNGNGYEISNITVVTSIQKQGNVFYKLENGTIMNVKFSNISITNHTSNAKLVGVVGAMNGGYISDIDLNNVSVVATSKSSTCVGGLVGQVIGGVNYIDHIVLQNDENQVITAGNKYIGGIVGNAQMDSGMAQLKLYVSYCVVRANLGDETNGGCVAGIVGRIKNDSAVYYMDVNNCYYQGLISTNGNYNGGIVGSIEGGAGLYNISQNVADVVFLYLKEGSNKLDAKDIATQLIDNPDLEYQAYAHKNCNPICGRATTIYSDVLGNRNVGSWAEYYSKVIQSTSMYFASGPDIVLTKDYLESHTEWDFEKDWSIDDKGFISLK